MDVKWNLVKIELLEHDRFRDCNDMKWETLRAKFNRMLSDVETKYAVSVEGANLSGLPEESMSERDHMLIGILEKNAEESADRAALKARDKRRQVHFIFQVKKVITKCIRNKCTLTRRIFFRSRGVWFVLLHHLMRVNARLHHRIHLLMTSAIQQLAQVRVKIQDKLSGHELIPLHSRANTSLIATI